MCIRFATGVTILTYLLPALAAVSAKPPPPPPRTMPGDVKASIQTRWLAPYVSATHRTIGAGSVLSVQWFGRDGKILRELSGPYLTAHSGYVLAYGATPNVVHAVNGSWQLP